MVRRNGPMVQRAKVGELDQREIDQVNEVLEGQSASAIARWAINRFGTGIVATTSMTDTVLLDVTTKADPLLEVVFIDTGFHFNETIDTLERAKRRYSLNLTLKC